MSARIAVVTGAFSFTGRFVAQELLARGWTVRTLTNSRYPDDPLAEKVERFPLDFSDSKKLAHAMSGAELFVNTYWIRYPHAGMTFETAVDNTAMLMAAARDAGVGGVVQVGVVGASQHSTHPYLRWKWRADEELRKSRLPHAIVQPTLIFGEGDVLIMNHAWLLRNIPAFFVAGDGKYPVQPVAGEDVARTVVDLADQDLVGQVVDVGGPEIYSYREFVQLIRRTVGSRSPIVCLPSSIVLATAKILGFLIRDRIVTRDVLKALTGATLASDEPATGTLRLDNWLRDNASAVGKRYVRRQTRHS